MPNGDKNGPRGEGPLTGRGLGYGGGYNQPGNQNNDGRLYDGRGGGQGNRSIGNRVIVRDKTLDAKVTGPGGHTPDGTGPHGRGTGPGGGIGSDRREDIDSLYRKYPDNTGEVNTLVAEAQIEATRQNLYGQERINYIVDYVKGRIKAKSIDTISSSRGTIGHLVNELAAEYIIGKSTTSKNQVTDAVRKLVLKYRSEAADKGYTGEKAKAYVRSKVQSEYGGKRDEGSDGNKSSKKSPNKKEATTKSKENSGGKSSKGKGSSKSSGGGVSSSK